MSFDPWVLRTSICFRHRAWRIRWLTCTKKTRMETYSSVIAFSEDYWWSMEKRLRRRIIALELAAMRGLLNIAVSLLPHSYFWPRWSLNVARKIWRLTISEILATLLNCGTSPTTGAQILKPETVGEMFTNHIPNFPNFGRQGIPAARPLLTNPLPDLYPTEADASQGWGLTMMLTNLEGGLAGRGQGTGRWAGLANLFWWCDPKKEVAGMLATQILPFGGMCKRSSCYDTS